jgi:peptidoglycan-associated lipoprotein
VANAYIKLISSDGTIMDSETDSTGMYKFMLKPETDYIILASATGYLKGKEKLTTKGLTEGKNFEKSVSLTSTSKVIELPNIFYDFGKATLREESKQSLNKLVEILNDNPNVAIELMAHTDSRGSEKANLQLSQERAQSVIDYLIDKGINEMRLDPVGYGESVPKVIDERIKEKVPFFNVGTKLDENFINQLTNEDYKEIAHQINRRTEFRVISETFDGK